MHNLMDTNVMRHYWVGAGNKKLVMACGLLLHFYDFKPQINMSIVCGTQTIITCKNCLKTKKYQEALIQLDMEESFEDYDNKISEWAGYLGRVGFNNELTFIDLSRLP